MKRFYDVECRSCGAVFKKWTSVEEIEEDPCPHCKKETLQRKNLGCAPSSSPSCGIRRMPGGWRSI